MSAPIISYGQNNEDVVLWRCFRDQPGGFYIDVGAGDPVVDSVTKLFYDNGWSGINAEPQVPLYMALLEQRPRDLNLNVAIGEQYSLLELHTAVDYWGLTTTDPAIAARHADGGVRLVTNLVPVVPLDAVLEAVAPSRLDFLKIDVEGAELSVLRGIDLGRWRPRVIVVEAAEPVFLGPGVVPSARPARSDGQWEHVLTSAGYVRALFDGINVFYVDPADTYLQEVLEAPANVLDNFVPWRFAQPLGYAPSAPRPLTPPAPGAPAAAPPAPASARAPQAGQSTDDAPEAFLLHVVSMSSASWQQVLRTYVNAFTATDAVQLLLWIPSDRVADHRRELELVSAFVNDNLRSTNLPRFEMVTDPWSVQLLNSALSPRTSVVAPDDELRALVSGVPVVDQVDKATMRMVVADPQPTRPATPAAVVGHQPSAFGVNLIGYFNAETGEGEVARQLAYGLEAAGVPYRAISLPESGKPNQREYSIGGERDVLYDVNLIAAAPHVLPVLAESGLREVMAGRYNIGLWAWEVEILPAAIAEAGAALVDEVWGISDHATHAIRNAIELPVYTYLPTIWPMPRIEEIERPAGWLTTFLYSFSFHSVTARKNPLGLVEAYRTAFPQPCGTRLVIKSAGGDAHPYDLAELRDHGAGRDDIVVADGYLSAAEQTELFDWCDAYVSLHRAEGYGYTMAEAMARAKPVIATGYSGNCEFMTPDTGLLIPHSLVLVGPGRQPYPPEARWADPDLFAASEAMRWLADHAEEGREIGRRARDHIGTHHVPSARAAFLRERIEAAHELARTS